MFCEEIIWSPGKTVKRNVNIEFNPPWRAVAAAAPWEVFLQPESVRSHKPRGHHLSGGAPAPPNPWSQQWTICQWATLWVLRRVLRSRWVANRLSSHPLTLVVFDLTLEKSQRAGRTLTWGVTQCVGIFPLSPQLSPSQGPASTADSRTRSGNSHHKAFRASSCPDDTLCSGWSSTCSDPFFPRYFSPFPTPSSPPQNTSIGQSHKLADGAGDVPEPRNGPLWVHFPEGSFASNQQEMQASWNLKSTDNPKEKPRKRAGKVTGRIESIASPLSSSPKTALDQWGLLAITKHG